MGLLSKLLGIDKSVKEYEERTRQYKAMSVRELKQLENDALREALDAILHFEYDSEDISKLNRAQITVLTVLNFDSEVQNGGLCQFFVNSSFLYAPFVSESLAALKMDAHKALFDKFISENRINLSDLSEFKTKKVKEYEAKTQLYPFDDFDDAFYALYETEPFEEKLISYVRKNADAVFAMQNE